MYIVGLSKKWLKFRFFSINMDPNMLSIPWHVNLNNLTSNYCSLITVNNLFHSKPLILILWLLEFRCSCKSRNPIKWLLRQIERFSLCTRVSAKQVSLPVTSLGNRVVDQGQLWHCIIRGCSRHLTVRDMSFPDCKCWRPNITFYLHLLQNNNQTMSSFSLVSNPAWKKLNFIFLTCLLAAAGVTDLFYLKVQ